MVTDVTASDQPSVAALEQGYTAAHRRYEVCGIAAALGLGAWLGLRLAAGALGALHPAWLVGSIAAGIAAADLVSGLVHWGFDTWGTLETPVVGRLAIRAFRQHHLDPSAMLAHDFIETNGHNCMLAVVPLGAGLWVLSPQPAGPGALALGTFLFSWALFVSLTSQIHKWAHTPRPPWPIAWLQRARLVLPPEHHALHHLAPHARRYCITTGWLDALLDAVGLWGAIERLVTRSFGITPGRDPAHG